MIIDVLELEEHRLESVDVCIVGAGTAGLPLAHALAERGFTVAVVERGGSAERLSAPHEMDGSKLPETTSQRGWIQAIGGTSHIWGGRLLGLDPSELEAHPELGLSGWPLGLSELERHTGAIESLFQIPAGTFGKPAEWIYQAFARPLADTTVTPRYPVTVERRFRNVARLLRAPGTSQLTVYANAFVCGFSLDRATARLASVEAKSIKGNRLTVSAKQFVLAAGAVESTGLLLWLDRLEGGNVFRASQNLGRYLQDHIDYPSGLVTSYRPRLLSALMGLRSREGARRVVHFGLGPDVQLSKSLPNAYLSFQISQPDTRQIERVRTTAIGSSSHGIRGVLRSFSRSPRDIPFAALLASWYLLKTSGYRPRGVNVVAQIATEQLPSWSNRICLSDSVNRFQVPEAQVSWDVTGRDDEKAQLIQSEFREFWIRSGLAHHCTVQWQFAPREGSGKVASLFHPSGCIAMGTDRNASVLAPDLSCHDIANLSVLSTAVLPRAGSGNPTMPLLQLAFRLASSIESKLRGTSTARSAEPGEAAAGLQVAQTRAQAG